MPPYVGVTMVTVNGSFLNANGGPGTGHLVFDLLLPTLPSSTDDVSIQTRYLVALDSTGAFTVDLPSADVDDPAPWTYRVTENVLSSNSQTFCFSLSSTPNPIKYADLTVVPDPTAPGVGPAGPAGPTGPAGPAGAGATAPLDLFNTPSTDLVYGAKTTGDANDRLQILANGNIMLGDGTAAPDTLALTRIAAGIVEIDAELITGSTLLAPEVKVKPSTSGGSAIDVLVSGDANERLLVKAEGSLNWGNGTAVADTSISRTAPGVLSTPGALNVGTNYDYSSYAGYSAAPSFRAVKGANQTVNNSTTFVLDSDLVFPVLNLAFNKRYAFDAMLFVTTNSTANFKLGWDLTASTGVFKWGRVSTPQDNLTYDETSFVSATSIGSPICVWIRGVLIGNGNPGTATIHWAQNVADVSNTIVLAGSWLEAKILDN
jgi:hypothetical protein